MQITPDILRRYHLGQCTPEEEEAVSRWLESEQLGSFTGEITEKVDLRSSGQSMWHMLESKLDQQEQLDDKVVALSYRRRRRWLAYAAASVAITVLAFIGYKNLGTKYNRTETINSRLVHVPFGAKKILNLTDGSKVYLNAGATLQFPEAFVGETRKVTLKGEAYFEIAPDKKKPFIIQTIHDTQIKVVGTAFNILAEPDRDQVEVSVSQGIVHFMQQDGQQTYVELTAGQSAVYDHQLQTFARGEIAVDKIATWKDNRLVFNQETLADVARRLERWYGYDIDIQKKSLLNKKYNAQYTDPHLEEIVESMAFVLEYKYKIDTANKKITIY